MTGPFPRENAQLGLDVIEDERASPGTAAVVGPDGLEVAITGLGGAGAAVGPPEPSAARIRALAGTLAGYRWPGREGRLRQGQQAAAERIARQALLHLNEEPD